MIQEIYTVKSNERIAKSTMKMVLTGGRTAITAPGQFINLKIDGFFLRRPISVCDWSDKYITIIYKIVGGGTEALSKMPAGQKIDALSGLGNGYDISKAGKHPLLIGGGVGVPPLYGLAKALIAQGITPAAILGFNTAAEVFFEKEFAALGVQTYVCTADGSAGQKGFVTDIMNILSYTYFYTCGPEPMLRAIDLIAVSDGQMSFEERMGCGFGACMGCSCKTKYGSKRICKDGPVLERNEIIW